MDSVESSTGGAVGSADAAGLLTSDDIDDVDGSVTECTNASTSTTGGIVPLTSRLGGTSSPRGAGTSCGDVDVEVDAVHPLVAVQYGWPVGQRRGLAVLVTDGEREGRRN